MQLTSSIPNERRVAESILGDAPIPHVDPAAGIQIAAESQRSISDTRPSKRQRVSPEFARCSTQISLRRQTAERSLPTSAAPRPPAPRCVWVFGVTVSSGSGGGDLRTAGGAHGRTPSRGRAVTARHPALSHVRCSVDRAGAFRGAASDTPRTPGHSSSCALWTCREQDLMAELHDCRARLRPA